MLPSLPSARLGFGPPPEDILLKMILDDDQGTFDTLDEGPFVIGYTCCFVLMGILLVQCFIYFNRFPNDRMWTKALVSVTLLLETLITVFVFHGFWIGATQRGSNLSMVVATGVGGQRLDPDPLWSYVALAPLTGLVSSLTHGFFCWRIWAVRNSMIVPVLVMMVSLVQFAMVTYGGVVYGLVPDLTDDRPMPFYVPVWLVGSLVCDSVITVYMTLSLIHCNEKSGFKHTKSLFKKLIKLTIETGLITTTAALIELVLSIAFRVTLYHIALFYIISKLYANCMLATLNSRTSLNKSVDRFKTAAIYDDWHSSSHSGGTPARNSANVIQIHTKVETTIEMDPYPNQKNSMEV
ncbi:hypothetical protein DEU56DRAFT_955304 [Suillus clintonianus]|uniref:uncharacterized protein n=1 Tax=Suillus clintonianus TaxID=1904413 RepID=UPI001B85C0B4|nr:uncharacterized protein DEU56DRAFT_955304 [Suillus clintonianus]KAG2153280.1 hypothetical protein DEU56DRAFT_955304 [Suillus clintonianus]